MEKPSKVDVFLVSFQIEFLQLFSANATILKKDAQNSPELKIHIINVAQDTSVYTTLCSVVKML